ncbi:hypothetical protein FXO37_28468 [Capsicum annuum]|nr:hypothetical protein FXO37_28468 [Capsicum annuum]
MDEQLDKHLARIFGENNKKGFEECEVTKVVEEWELDPKKLKIIKFIAEGAYGSVYKVLNLMELSEFRIVTDLTISNSPDILKNYLSSFTETDTKTVGSSRLTDMPQIRYYS